MKSYLLQNFDDGSPLIRPCSASGENPNWGKGDWLHGAPLSEIGKPLCQPSGSASSYREARLWPGGCWVFCLGFRNRLATRLQQLARAIGGGGTVSLGPGASQPGTAAQPAPAASGGDTAATPAAIQQRLDALEKQVAGLRQAGAASYASSYDRGFAMDQTFARPVAIGFRSVGYDLMASQQ
jgi:hypothetical protein